MSLSRRAFAPTERRAAGEWGNSDPPPPGGGGFGGPMSETAALQIMAVYGSVGVIADSIASLPWQLFSTPDPAKRRELPLTQILKKPYVEISRMDWLTQYVMSMALRGEFFGQVVERDQDFYPSQIKPVHPDAASVRRLMPSGAIEYRFHSKVVPTDNVVHIRNLSVAGSLRGLNPIEYLRVSLGQARSQDSYGAAYFTNSANPEGVIEVEDELDPAETLAMAKNWIAAHGGVNRAHLPAVLTGGAKWNPISVNPKDSQFLESKQYSAGTISGMIFRVPPHMVGIVDRTTSWGTGIEQQEMGFVKTTLPRYIGGLEEAVDAMHPDEQYARLNLAARLRGDKLSRFKAHAIGIGSGFLNPDDARADEDMAPIPDGKGQTFLVPINSQTLDQALAEEDAPPAPAGTGNDPTN